MVASDSPSSRKYKRGENPKSLANLIPHQFPPGTNGNPHPGYPLAERLQDSLRKPLQKPAPDAPAGEHIVYSTLVGAKLREPTPFKEVWDRTEGKVIDTHEIKGVIPITVVEIVKDYGDSGRPEALSPGT